ncbi:putative M23-family secreted peptidase [Actinoplanes missouriensis 431]|uniref:Putative M23-family secreted peptidase n=1 Tax=Actinoplanes missouriensis (strain ATCC 14538 / DSM 43046 / CBS 188.64 / JCM 3121 / NBRC 102363 / NCIMB 12654 / NRRL B-3342 / UNCC 431) TaxID=512565 RepID=I0GYU6_ACTM4|nr:M23 family metallopeptidase [Actinoplanes missouriensis]BAL85933.1 putative M23-family secreted peptidase [Actinoplanes missouriensis 431]
MGQQSSSGRVGRHRQERLHRHRAPSFPTLFATRSRTALSVSALSATIAAGVTAAGVAASAAPGALAHLSGDSTSIGHTSQSAGSTAQATASHPFAELPVVAPAGDEAPAKRFVPGSAAAHEWAESVADSLSEPAVAAVQRKKRPVITTTAAATGTSGGHRTATTSGSRSGSRSGSGGQWVHPMPSAGVTSCFGPRGGRLHAGVDLAAAHGTPIVAAGAGTVVSAGPAGGYGNAVLIRHANGYLTHYGHMSEIQVAAGQRVTAGEQIGLEGSTGHSTGPHLHFEVHAGHYKNPIEPTAWMHAHGVDISGCPTP